MLYFRYSCCLVPVGHICRYSSLSTLFYGSCPNTSSSKIMAPTWRSATGLCVCRWAVVFVYACVREVGILDRREKKKLFLTCKKDRKMMKCWKKAGYKSFIIIKFIIIYIYNYYLYYLFLYY